MSLNALPKALIKFCFYISLIAVLSCAISQKIQTSTLVSNLKPVYFNRANIL